MAVLCAPREENLLSILRNDRLKDEEVCAKLLDELKDEYLTSEHFSKTCSSSEQSRSLLHVAAQMSTKSMPRTKTLALLLDRRADPAQKDSEGLTAAWYAILFCKGVAHSPILKQLVAATCLNHIWMTIPHADPSAESAESANQLQDVCMTLMHHAILQTEFSQKPDLGATVIKILLDARSNPNARILDPSADWVSTTSIHGFGPLHLAVRVQCVEVVSLLLCAMADANAAASDAWIGPEFLGQLAVGFSMHPLIKLTSLTPIGVLALPIRRFQSPKCWHAAERKASDPVAQAEILQKLIVAGGNTRVVVTYELSRYELSSIAHGFLSADSLAILLKDERGSGLVNHRATSVEIELGCATPLLAAICRCKQNYVSSHPIDEIPRKVSLLLNSRADVNGCTDRGLNPLHILSATSWPSQLQDDVFDQLFSAGVNINAVSSSEHAPLHVAAAFGTPFMVRKLLVSLADISLMDVRGMTAFHFAVAAHAGKSFEDVAYDADPSEDFGILKIANLVKAHADPMQLDRNGRSVLHHAVGRLDDQGLEAAGKVSRNSMIKGDREVARLDDAQDTEYARDERAWSGKEFKDLATLVEALSQHSGSTTFLSAPDRSSETPLHVAARCNRTWSVQILLANDADIDALDALGRTPLYWAGVQALLQRGDGAKALLLDWGAEHPMERPRDVALLRSKYQVAEKLGEGRYGSVYLAWRDPTSQFAMKIQASSLHCEKQAWKECVQNECTIMAKIAGHRNLVEIKEWEFEGPLNVIVLGLLDGPCIFDHFSHTPEEEHDTPIPEKDSLRYMSEVLSGLRHLHDLNIIHRDLKPDNCLFSTKAPDAHVVLVDFGLAREMPADGSLITRKTFSWDDAHGAQMTMSPEKELAKYDLRDEFAYGLPSDIWCAGVLAYILLSGTLPYPDAPDSFRPPKFPLFSHESLRHISSDTKSVIVSMLELDPLQRPNAKDAMDLFFGHLAKAEMKRLFRQYFPRQDGSLSIDEFAAVLVSLGDRTTDPNILLNYAYGRKPDGSVNWDEFVDWLYSDR